MASTFLALTVFSVLATLGIISIVVAIRIWAGDSVEYRRNRFRTGSFWNALRGEISPELDGGRDFHIAEGIAIRERKCDGDQRLEWVPQGRLSEEAISNVVSPKKRG